MTAYSTQWLVSAVEQYESLPTEGRALVDDALAELGQVAGAVPGEQLDSPCHWAIPLGEPDDHLVAHAVEVDHRTLVVTRLLIGARTRPATRPRNGPHDDPTAPETGA